jgi:hypothetical protein
VEFQYKITIYAKYFVFPMKLQISDQNTSVDGVRNKNVQEFSQFLSFSFFFSLSPLRIPSGMVGKPQRLA